MNRLFTERSLRRNDRFVFDPIDTIPPIALGLFALGSVMPDAESLPIPCIFRILTGFPCPTCGSGRALYYLAHAQPLEAFLVSPVMALALVALAVGSFRLVITRWIARDSTSNPLAFMNDRRTAKIVLGLLAANWIYVMIFDYYLC